MKCPNCSCELDLIKSNGTKIEKKDDIHLHIKDVVDLDYDAKEGK